MRVHVFVPASCKGLPALLLSLLSSFPSLCRQPLCCLEIPWNSPSYLLSSGDSCVPHIPVLSSLFRPFLVTSFLSSLSFSHVWYILINYLPCTFFAYPFKKKNLCFFLNVETEHFLIMTNKSNYVLRKLLYQGRWNPYCLKQWRK